MNLKVWVVLGSEDKSKENLPRRGRSSSQEASGMSRPAAQGEVAEPGGSALGAVPGGEEPARGDELAPS